MRLDTPILNDFRPFPSPPPPNLLTPPLGLRSKKRNPYGDKNYGSAITLLQFLFIALVRAPYQVVRAPAGSLLPLRFSETLKSLWRYAHMTLIFFVMMYLNNVAFSFNISQPLHMVFRSANLMVSYAWGIFVEREPFTRQQLVSVVLITGGAAAATFAEVILGDTAAVAAGRGGCTGAGDCGAAGAAARVAAAGGGGGGRFLAALLDPNAQGALYLVRWWLGVSILAAVLLLQTYLGSLQNSIRKEVKDVPGGSNRFTWETLFFFHFFALPCFALSLPALPATMASWSASPPLGSELAWPAPPLLAPLLSVPIMWVHVAVNVVTQFVCLCGVYTLIGLTDQLTVNVALTVRKFFSLLLSIWLFNNTFTWLHWLGALCVIFGTALYQGLFGKDIFREPSCAATISPPSTPEGAKRSA